MSSPERFEIVPIGATIADTHAHLDMLDDPGGALARAALAGVALVITVVDPTEDAERTFADLDAWRATAAELIRDSASHPEIAADAQPLPRSPEVRVIIGAHPHNAKDFGVEAREKLRGLSAHRLVVGIGEIGLDYHYDHSPRDVQRAVFAEQLETAVDLHMPVAVHLREAHDDGEAIMRHVGLPAEGCVLHCFTGDAVLLDPFLDLGCYISFAGPVTFKRADAIREAATLVPLERLLVETDSPFMTPEPYRGRPNEPALTVFTARRIAEARGLGDVELARATWDNSVRLYARSDEPCA